MSVELSNKPAGLGDVHDALAEIRGSAAELRTYFGGLFDCLTELAGNSPNAAPARRHLEGERVQASLDEQIERLAVLTAELAKSVDQHKKLTGKS